MSRLTRIGLPVAAVILAAVAARLIVASAHTFNAWLAVFLGAAVALHVFLLPTAWLPSMALVIHVLVPAPPIPLASALTPSVAVVILLIWVIRRLFEKHAEHGVIHLDWKVLTLPVAVGLWYSMSLVLSTDPPRSLGWLFVFGTSILLYTIVPVTTADADLLLRTWVVVGALIALHVMFESILQSDLLYGWFYRQLGVDSIQHWSSYRPEGSFRHPLSAALFLATTSAISLGEAVRRSKAWFFLPALMAGAAAVLTLSRGSVGALVMGGLVVWSMWHPGRFPKFSALRHTSGLVGTSLLVGIVNFGPFAARLDSIEAARSSETRTEVMRIAISSSWEQGPFGGGPGMSQQVISPVNTDGLPIESSLLQLLVSTGLIGVLLFMALMLEILRRGVLARSMGAVAGLTTYLITVSVFNVFEAKESLLVFGGLLIIACRRPPDVDVSTSEPRVESDRLVHS